MGDHKRLSERKTSKIRGYKKARREIALRMRQAKIAKAAERNINEGNEGEVEQPGEPGVVQGPGLVQVQVVADIHMPPAQRNSRESEEDSEINIYEGNEGEVEQPGEPGVIQGPVLVQV